MKLSYRPEIDGLRALAVIPVILFHAGFELFSGGFVGVDVFFVISGYLITSILIEDIENKRFSIAHFYERRARRILPALFVVMLTCIPFAWMWMMPDQLKDFAQSLVAVSFFVSNILFWRESGYFAAAAEEKPLLHTWSLAIEEQYYFLFPIFLLLAWRFGKNRVFWMIVVLAGISLLLSEWGWRKQPTANFYLAPTRAWELFAGSIAAFIVQKKGIQKNNFIALIGLFAILISIFIYDKTTPFPSLYTAVPVIGTVLIILYADKKTYAAKLLSTKTFVGIGLISYSAYLWHQPIFAFARIELIEPPSNILMGFLVLATFFLAYGSWKYIEKPFRQRDIIGKKELIYILIALSIIILYSSLYILKISNKQNQNSSNLSKVYDERQIEIRSGICHFNKRGKNKNITDFLENWNCLDDDEGLTKTGILITGDSHSADKALALRLNNYDSYQIGGAGCQLSEEYVSNERIYCKEILKKAHNLADKKNIKAIFLSNRFDEAQLSLNYLQSIIDYWGDIKKPIFLWSPMPNYESQKKAYLKGSSPQYSPNFAREIKFYELVSKLKLPANFKVVKTSDFWCSNNISIGCLSFSTEILMADNDHLSVNGARLFGDVFIQNPIFNNFVNF
jgi:peptidoglycan/LPS O-acetylase OafA/YrhL